MKDSISIIFTAIIGTFLIVILPLYSILDRQDSMSYNVVLTATTNFVDQVRNNGFIDRDSYFEYIAKLATTTNTYKVNLEVYKKILIKETDEFGNVIDDSFVEEKELYNTQDILDALDADVSEEKSNIKNKVYLLNEDDEFYVRIKNTNITTGSLLYSLVSDKTNPEVINISYGGIVNKVNWELYDRINSKSLEAPEALISVPINANGNTNIKKIDKDEELENLECLLDSSTELNGDTTVQDVCADLIQDGQRYVYLYDLTKNENKTIKVAVELRGADRIDIGKRDYIKVEDLEAYWSNNESSKHIIDNYIRYDGFYAEPSITYRKKESYKETYYVLDITFTNVTMSQIDNISSIGKITVLPGLGIDKYGTTSTLAESVEFELNDATDVNAVTISPPIKWKKLLKTASIAQSMVTDNTVYVNEEIAFLISYMGIVNEQNETDEERDIRILNAIKTHLKIYDNSLPIKDLEYITQQDMRAKYGINLYTTSAGHVILKFKYDSSGGRRENYISLPDGWIETNLEGTYDTSTGEEARILSVGAESVKYNVEQDSVGPQKPTIDMAGTLGKNGWYVSDVSVILIPSNIDRIRNEIGGSGVYKNTVLVDGANQFAEQETTSILLDKEGTSYARAIAEDYVGNKSDIEEVEIKIDKTKPTDPIINLSGTKGNDRWYKSDVKFTITPGNDERYDYTTYRIEGANKLDESRGTSYTLTKEGKSTIIATTYDKAGNKSEATMDIFIDKSNPPEVTIQVIEGKTKEGTDWYYESVKVRVTVDEKQSASGHGVSSYRITGASEVITTQFEGNTADIMLNTSGIHTIEVYTSTQAGNYKTTTKDIKIDYEEPNEPIIEFAGTKGDNDWYTTSVMATVKANGDKGGSGIKEMEYTVTVNGITTKSVPIGNNGTIDFTADGEYILNITAIDNALNKVTTSKIIKIDTKKPNSAEFVINGTKGKDGWYISDVFLSYKGGSDEVSGIQNVTLSNESITENTNSTLVTLTTKDNAGHTVTKEINIKLDKYAPTQPTISFIEEPTGTGDIWGYLLYNKNVEVIVDPGKNVQSNGSELDKTTLEIVSLDGNATYLSETAVKSKTITQEGMWKIIARTYDKAGNVAENIQNVSINKKKPDTPKLISINGVEIGNAVTKDVTGDTNILQLELENIQQGNLVTIEITEENEYKQIEFNETASSSKIQVELPQPGKYKIKIKQTNMYGTISEQNYGEYTYTY